MRRKFIMQKVRGEGLLVPAHFALIINPPPPRVHAHSEGYYSSPYVCVCVCVCEGVCVGMCVCVYS